MIFNDIFKNEFNVNDQERYWNELGVNFSKINEYKELNKIINTKLKELSKENLEALSKILKINNDKNIIDNILNNDKIINLIYLENFLKRKKKAVKKLYDYTFINTDDYEENISDIIKLFQLFCYSKVCLFEIYTLNEWINKGTGIEYTSTSTLSIDKLNEFSNKDILEQFCDFISDTPKVATEYKVRMNFTYNNSKIFLIYKLKNDTQINDFDEAKRVKNIEKILFMIDTDTGILHIKCKNLSERTQIRKYFENFFKVTFNDTKTEIFESYDAEEFKNNFNVLNTVASKIKGDFYVTKITFINSLLYRSPELTLDNYKKDVWPSVVNAFNMKILDINSLDSIKNMTIKFNNRTRNIRTIKFKNGDVMFSLDDKGISEIDKENIEKNFKIKFNIPLNMRIKNKLEKGYIDQVDSLLRNSNIIELSLNEKDILNKLEQDKLVNLNIKRIAICKNEACGRTYEDNIEEIIECEECGNDKFDISEATILEIKDDNIKNLIKSYLCKALNLDDNNIKESDKYKEYCCLRFLYNRQEHNIIITNKIIPKRTIKSIEKKLIPTIIIYYGIDNEQAKLMTPNSIEMLQFTKLYISNEDTSSYILEESFKRLEKMLHYQIVNAAMLANSDLDNIKGEPSTIRNNYSPTDFEDDIYALLKDIIFNSAKWGASDIGKPLPEGVLTFQYNENNGSREIENRVAFTFDCKLTKKNEGYDLGSSEKRKAIDYVNKFNKTMEIQRYCTNGKQLTSHIFISNKFKKHQVNQVTQYFQENINKGNSTIPVFIDFRNLIELHSWYRINYESIQKNRDYFYMKLYELFSIGNRVISSSDFNELINDLEYCFLDNRSIDLKKVKETVLKR